VKHRSNNARVSGLQARWHPVTDWPYIWAFQITVPEIIIAGNARSSIFLWLEHLQYLIWHYTYDLKQLIYNISFASQHLLSDVNSRSDELVTNIN